MKLTHILLSIIIVLLGLTTYYSYHAALVYGPKRIINMTDDEKERCANGGGCAMEWHLAGS